MNKYIVSVSVTQPSYESDEYGNIECEPRSILVSTIRVARAATGFGLRESREAVERVTGSRVQTGRVVLQFLVDEAGLGRIYALKREMDAVAHTARVPVNKIEILGLQNVGRNVIGAI